MPPTDLPENVSVKVMSSGMYFAHSCEEPVVTSDGLVEVTWEPDLITLKLSDGNAAKKVVLLTMSKPEAIATAQNFENNRPSVNETEVRGVFAVGLETDVEITLEVFDGCLLEVTCVENARDVHTAVKPTRYGTEMEFTCPLANEFVDKQGPNMTTTCQWDGKWSENKIPECKCKTKRL